MQKVRTLVVSIFSLAALGLLFFPSAALAANPYDITAAVQKVVAAVQNQIARAFPALPFAQQTTLSPVYAQIAGNGGGEGSMVIYFQGPNGPLSPTGPTACPASWNEAYAGYGPHYVALLLYDWITSGGSGGGFEYTTPPPGGGIPPRTGPPGFGGGLPPPDSREPWDPPPPGGSGPQGPNPGGNVGGPVTPGNNPMYQYYVPPKDKHFADLIKTAYAAGGEYVIKDVAIGSDSICSTDELEVVPSGTFYNDVYDEGSSRFYARACFTNSSGVTTCNRCRVCYK